MNVINKPLPYDIEVEKEILGSIFLHNELLCEIIEILSPEDFYKSSHCVIYEKLIEMFNINMPIDFITFKNYISENCLNSIGGISYIAELVSSYNKFNNIKVYAEIVKEKSQRRKLIKTLSKACNEAFESKELSQILKDIDSSLVDIYVNKGNSKSDFSNTILTDDELMNLTISDIEKGFKQGGKIPGISTGYKKLDNYTNGILKKDLILIAGTPFMCKTCFVLNLAENISKENKKVALFEFEMSAEKLGKRRLATSSLIKSSNLQKGKLTSAEWKLIVKKAKEKSDKNNIFTDVASSLTVDEIKARCRRLKIQNQIDVVIIDNLNLIETNNSTSDRASQLSEITRQLKIMAKQLDIALILICKLNRVPQQRQNKRPTLDDLRELGTLEQYADMIMLLHKDDYYNTHTKDKGVLEVIIAKNSEGTCGIIKLSYNAYYQLITDIAYEQVI